MNRKSIFTIFAVLMVLMVALSAAPVYAQGPTTEPVVQAGSSDLQVFIFGAATVLIVVISAVSAWLKDKRFETITGQLANVNANPLLIDKLEALATKVVPVETLHKGWDLTNKVLETLKAFTPDKIDALIVQVQALGDQIAGKKEVQPPQAPPVGTPQG